MSCFFKHRLSWLVAVVIMHLIGCASVPPASQEFELKATKFSPPLGTAAVYVYRQHSIVGSAVLFLVSLDYKDFGSVATDTFLYGPINSGEHVIKVGGGIPLSVASIKFNAEAGKLYFFEVSPSWIQIKIESVNEAEGREKLGKLRLSGDNAFEFSEKVR